MMQIELPSKKSEQRKNGICLFWIDEKKYGSVSGPKVDEMFLR